MEKIEKRPYELSIWEDYINENGEHDERKIAIFGSHLMKSKSRALSPKLVRKVNGEITFSFDMMYRYWDEDEMEEIVNPNIKFLVNERKIKLKYKNKWYDLVIKQVDENPEKNTFSYTAKSLWTNELGRQGYSLSFSEEENNNQGTLKKLTEAALKDTDWLFDEENSYKPPQLKECPIYKVTLSMLQATAYKMLDNNTKKEINKGNITIFLNYNEGEITEESDLKGRQFILPIDDKIEYDDNMFIKGDVYIFDKKQEIKFGFENSELVIGGRGKFVVSQPLSHYDKLLDRYVYEYKDSKGNDVYGYANTNYTETAATKELITNGSSIANSTGWFVWRDDLREKLGELDLKIREEIKEDGEKKRIGYLEKKLSQFDDRNNGKYAYIANSGLWDNFSIFKEAKVNEEYIIAFPHSDMYGIEVSIKWYPADSNKQPVELFHTKDRVGYGCYKNNDIEYYYSKVKCTCSMSAAELYTGKIYFLIQEVNVEKGQTDREIVVEGMSFFKYIYNSETNNITDRDFILPNEVIYSSVQVENLYFKPSKNYKTAEEIQHLDSKATYELQYPSDYQMIRDIKIQESNRFNIIQTLAETFEVWPEFIINHDDQGYILKDEDGRQQKYIRFNQYTGRRNYAGFRYGVNLKKVERKVESDTITSKIFVKQNSNKFAPNGNCRISEAEDNVIKEDFLFNFEYFLNQGLLNRVDFTNDLYSTEGKHLGYYEKLAKINKNKEELHNRISQNQILLTSEQASLEHLQLTLTSLKDSKGECAAKVENGSKDIYSYINSNIDWINGTNFNVSDEIVKNIRQWIFYDEQEKTLNLDLLKVQENISNLEKTLNEDYSSQNKIKEDARELHTLFHNKYSNFIQEGSWISEDYTDPNLYFLDAANVLATSATPKITYSIEAIAIDQIPEWKNYTFNIGDITFMEDEKFFGYIVDSLGIKVPRKEEIIISEITEELEEQSKDKIVAQNFKTQFEDLFQRITATVETLQFKEGEYNRSAGSITAQGKIDKSILDSTLLSNTSTIQNIQDGTVVWGSNGITVKNENTPNEISKIAGKGILISTDGGMSWITGISPQGINASLLSGVIDCSKVVFKNTIDSLTIGKGIFLNTEDVADRNNIIFNSLKVTRNGILYGHPNNENWGYIKFNIDPKGIDTKNGSLDAQGMRISAPFGKGMLQGTWYVNKDFLVIQDVIVAGTIYAKQGTAIISDEKLKNSISLVGSKYETFFDNLTPRTFKYNNGTSDRYHNGFIAQEVKAALDVAGLSNQDFAGLVIQNYDSENQGDWNLRYEEFIPLNTWQIQKLKSRISELENEIQKLKEKLI